MTLASYSHALAGARSRRAGGAILTPLGAKAVIVAAVGLGAAGGLLATDADTAARAAAHAGEGLARLLRAMALIKLAMAGVVVAAIVWRLASPVSAARLAAYALVCVSMAAGPGLIWSMAHVVAGAAFLHAGLIVGCLMLWRDPAVSRRIAALVAARRASRR